jgi:hypothetical protein
MSRHYHYHYPAPRRGGFILQHPLAAFFLFAIVAGAIIKFWYLIAIAGLCWVAWKCWQKAKAEDARTAAEDAQVMARADYEHHQFLAGNPVGLYGQYMPPPEVR